ncbi:ankyrin repeat domain-containing protein [Streptomyces sp. NPDC026673]|uniref:ankyrin repeat domain-containing protein n=1 Tax=Streptomyces sp. NPDC026673 TaxID=3155724 RepID=UPI0033CA5965
MNRRRRKKLSRELVNAARRGDLRTAGELLRRGASPEHADPDGTTPLYAAAVDGAPAVAALLLAAGARPDTESGHGDEGTPLCAAACWGDTETVRQLLAHGADPGLREDHGAGLTPLEWAERGPHPETAELLRAAAARRAATAER